MITDPNDSGLRPSRRELCQPVDVHGANSTTIDSNPVFFFFFFAIDRTATWTSPWHELSRMFQPIYRALCWKQMQKVDFLWPRQPSEFGLSRLLLTAPYRPFLLLSHISKGFMTGNLTNVSVGELSKNMSVQRDDDRVMRLSISEDSSR